MAKLTLMANGCRIDEFELAKERISIGRRPDNDIPIDNLAVSGYHARLVKLQNDTYIEDLKSTNGIRVNSKPVVRQALGNGDIIDIGTYQLKYTDATAPAQAQDLYPQGEANPAYDTSESGTASPDDLARLQVLSGSKAGHELGLSKRMTTVGRPGVAVAAITQRTNGFYIVEVENNDNRTMASRLNGDPLNAHTMPLNNHDIIEIAGIKMEFYLSSSHSAR